MKSRVFFLCYLVLFNLNFGTLRSQEIKENKFRQRQATDDSLGYPNLDEDDLLNTQCPQHLELRWQTEVSSSIYATPLVADINSDGKLEVVVPSFIHYLEVLEGSDGDKMPGWPAFHQSTVHSSPLLYDIDKDGVREIVLATYNGEVLFFRVSGYMMSDKLEIPRLKVKRDWYVDLREDPVDRSHPDVHDDALVQEALRESLTHHNGSSARLNTSNPTTPEVHHEALNTSTSVVTEAQLDPVNSSNVTNKHQSNDTHGDSHTQMPDNMNSSSLGSGLESVGNAENETKTGRRLLEDNVIKGSNNNGSESVAKSNGEVHTATVENDESLEANADSSFELFRDTDELADEYNYDYDDYVDEAMWGDQEWTEAQHEMLENYVHIDAHVLCTPVIADIDNDGISEMIVAVSYFFDHEYYDNPEHSKDLGGIDIGKYVAGGIVVFNLDTKQVKWTTQLDLSTDNGSFRAYIYSSPTVVDLDGDGCQERAKECRIARSYEPKRHSRARSCCLERSWPPA